jgi:hypothetical protein
VEDLQATIIPADPKCSELEKYYGEMERLFKLITGDEVDVESGRARGYLYRDYAVPNSRLE